MSHKLIDHSPDLKRLRDEGYEIEVTSGYLLIHHIPYVNYEKVIKFGIFACQLNLATNDKTSKPNTHVIYFQGEDPCDKGGNFIMAIRHVSSNQVLFNNFIVNHSFSNKPANGYENYYELVKRYCDIVSAPAKSIDDKVTERTFKPIASFENESVFQYLDSNSSRSNINLIAQKLFEEKVGIIGLGGTGSYILDLISKSPVKEIRIIDGDQFLQHNAFRSPGAASMELLDKQMFKTEYFKNIYSNIHKNISSYDEYINAENLKILDGLTFVFISVDKGPIKKIIMDYLLEINIPFIDVGMGINRLDDSLLGTIRVTTATNLKNDHISKRISVSENIEDEYNTNIQIAELNALNASLAVIKWKKLCGFYNDMENEHHTTYSINVSQLLNDEITI